MCVVTVAHSLFFALLPPSPMRLSTQDDSPPTAAKLQAIEAGLQLLLQLLHAGRPAGGGGDASSRRLYMLDALPCLLRCSALDLVPEEPGMVPPGRQSLRHRLSKVRRQFHMRVVMWLAHAECCVVCRAVYAVACAPRSSWR